MYIYIYIYIYLVDVKNALSVFFSFSARTLFFLVFCRKKRLENGQENVQKTVVKNVQKTDKKTFRKRYPFLSFLPPAHPGGIFPPEVGTALLR